MTIRQDWRSYHIMVIPAYAGMYCINHWIPAFAGMTTGCCSDFLPFRHPGPASWIPAFAGMTAGCCSGFPAFSTFLRSFWQCRRQVGMTTSFITLSTPSFPAPRHSSESWNPVVYVIHSRRACPAGMTVKVSVILATVSFSIAHNAPITPAVIPAKARLHGCRW